MKKKIVVLMSFIILIGLIIFLLNSKVVKVKKIDSIPEGNYQAQIVFPDWKGYVDDTLAMNSMYSFDGYEDQGRVYLDVKNEVKSFDLFINNKKIDVSKVSFGYYEVDISDISNNGINTIQISNIKPYDLEDAIKVYIPYTSVINGNLKEVGLKKEPFDLIDEIIQSDINNGFTSAQLAVIKDGKLVYQNAWGRINSYNQDGSTDSGSSKVTNDTLYDLASNTKMYSVAYAVQYLIDKGSIKLDDKIVDILGNGFVDNTMEIKFASFKDNYPGLSNIKKWKSNITIKDVLMHQAGFPDSGHYHNKYFDAVNQKLDNNVKNVLYVADSNKKKTLLEGIFKTPLIYEPRTKTMYSDIDYMLLGLVVEKVTDKDLNTFLKETFWEPIGLEHITYNPLDNGFKKDDCAATEINGNTRDGLIDFPRIRKETIKCEVHDEESYYMMEGMSGHAGLFANATDLAKLASVMLTGGYGNNKFFTKNTRDLFISPQGVNSINYGIGWWREADDKRVWYFGTQTPESTVGHQGWTGTLTMIDFENNMVIVYLTNSINTLLTDNSSLDGANGFSGKNYTSATLGFVPQIIYMGLNNENNLDEALDSLILDMVNGKKKLEKEIGANIDEDHSIVKARKALEEVSKKRNN